MWPKVIIGIVKVGFNDDSCYFFIINLIVKKS